MQLERWPEVRYEAEAAPCRVSIEVIVILISILVNELVGIGSVYTVEQHGVVVAMLVHLDAIIGKQRHRSYS